MADYYELLNVKRDASQDEIKRAFRKLARDLHPDRNPDNPEAEAKFKEVAAAYETLSDPERRAHYDRFGESGPGASNFAGASVSDIFEAFFGGNSPFGAGFGGGGRRSDRGADIETDISIDFADAVLGWEAPIEVPTLISCETCEATGLVENSKKQTCQTCSGQGSVRQLRNSILGQMVTTATCHECDGAGEIIIDPCQECAGSGRVESTETYTLDIPAGVDSGATLRLSGRGAAGYRGGPFGDLYVRLRVAEHDRFTRDGQDLIAHISIPMTVAALGGEVIFETLEGTETLAIGTGTQSGKVIRLSGQGVPGLNGRRRGDIRVIVTVVTPEKLSDEEKELLEQFAQLRGEEVDAGDKSLLGRIRSALS